MPRDRAHAIHAIDRRRIPKELEQFLRHDAFSLVVKGKAGTGKTSLALTILSMYIEKQNCLYISSRQALSELFEYYPWVQNFVSELRNEDGNSENQENPEIAPFVDARLDEPQSLFERITNQLMDASSPLIVIDTWDAVGDFMDKEALMTNAKILQIWRQRARAKLIFVLESVEEIIFDNLVDGVIELEEGYVNSRRIRRIRLTKLRGVKIEKPQSFFTLNEGIFHSFEQYDQVKWIESTDEAASGDNVSEATEQSLETISGSSITIEDILKGRIPKHTVVSVELDPTVGSKAIVPLMARIASGYSKKNDVVLLPPLGLMDKNIDDLLKSVIPNPRQRKRVEVMSQKSATESANGSAVQLIEILKKIISKNSRKERNSEVLGLLNLGPFFNKERADLENFAQTLTSDFDASVVISRSSEKFEKLSEIADVRIKIIELDGNLFVQPENPWAGLYGIENELNGEIISVRPMV